MIRAARTAGAQSEARRRRRASAGTAAPQQPYVHGSAAEDFWEETVLPDSMVPAETRIAVRRNREHFKHMSPKLVMYFLGMLILMASMLVMYIKLRSDITTTTNEIVALETELKELRDDNDETYKMIVNNLDLEAIREKAINELGMTYASRDQVVTYSNSQEETVHQIAEAGD
ncbi:MAG: hypothetical protein IKG66_00205 [Lachnospiraceae bacterium]|nr:hypothetical protein [Lachnospiraceae bacterium]